MKKCQSCIHWQTWIEKLCRQELEMIELLESCRFYLAEITPNTSVDMLYNQIEEVLKRNK